MSIRTDRCARTFALLLGCLVLPAAAAAQKAPPPPANTPIAPTAQIVSHEVDISRQSAVLRLELSDGRTMDLSIDHGQALRDGALLGAVARGSELDRSWRELLGRASYATSDELPAMLKAWEAADPTGSALDKALEQAVDGVMAAPDAPAVPAPISDSLQKLQERIAELEAQKGVEADIEAQVERKLAQHEDRWNRGPFYYFGRGFGKLFSALMMYIVLFGVGIATILFGGRKYIEGVADTAASATMRSFMVGIAGEFLTLPAFILGIIALAVSIIGIPALLLWVPLFPVAVVAALLLGYLAVAHVAGEKLAERRYYGSEWFQRSNSYYFLLTGLGLLLAFFVGSAVVTMGGPWLGFISGLLKFLAVMVTWAACTIGFGAVLLSRAGTQPIRSADRPVDPDLFTETDSAGAL